MDSSKADAAVPSELKSAINIALFQAQQTYMAAMDTQFAEYKAMFRQEMLTFMAQIRETVQCMYSVDSVPSEQQQLRAFIELPTALMAKETECLVDKWHNEALKAQQIPEPVLALESPPPEAAQEYVSGIEVIRELGAQAHQTAIHVDELRNSTDGSLRAGVSGDSGFQTGSLEILEQKAHPWPRLHARMSKVVSWPNWRGRLLREGDTSQPGKDPGTDPVVVALYRPRAGGGIPRLNLERKDTL
ncbi:hypothetical protein ACLKA6_010031 [Drosophila palustris]